MLQIIILLGLIGVAVDTVRAVHRERNVFAEFEQTTAIKWLVWLYPLPLAISLFIPSSRHSLFLIPFGILFYLPGIAVAAINRRRFERAGTDRADRAQRAADYVVMSGVFVAGCLLCLTVVLWVLELFGRE
jgi:hypothetical protein